MELGRVSVLGYNTLLITNFWIDPGQANVVLNNYCEIEEMKD